MSPSPGGGGRQVWIIGLCVALAFLAVDSVKRLEAIARTSTVVVDGSPAPLPDPESPSGFEGGQHRLILPTVGTDGYHWILQTEAILDGRGLRVRATEVDNAPSGREVHWSSLPRWWLVALAEGRAALRPGLTAPQALEQVAAGSGPLALALLLCALTPLVAVALGAWAAGVFSLVWVSLFPLYETFVAGVIDHHGVAAMAACVGLLLLVAGGGGWVKEASAASGGGTLPLPPERLARRWFAAAGVAGGVGLWVSASTTVPLLLGTAMGALLAQRLRPGEGDGIRSVAGMWRVWGAVGCATSLAAYALEYAPWHMGWRLEVNHPLYALAWLGLGDILARRGRRTAPGAIPGLLLAGGAPLALLLGGSEVFRPADPLLASLHGTGIREFSGMVSHLGGATPAQALLSVTLLPVLLPALIVLIRHDLRRAAAPARLALVAAPTVGMLALALWQVRWFPTGVAAMSALLVSAVALGGPGPQAAGRRRRGIQAALLLAILAPFPVATVLLPWRHGYSGAEDAVQVVARDLAHRLRARVGPGGAVVVAAPPMTTTWLVYFGGFSGLGTLYWENLPGLRATAELLSAPGEEEFLAVARRYGVTHVVLPAWEADVPQDGFLARALTAGPRPGWLVEIPYPAPAVSLLRPYTARLFEVRSGALKSLDGGPLKGGA